MNKDAEKSSKLVVGKSPKNVTVCENSTARNEFTALKQWLQTERQRSLQHFPADGIVSGASGYAPTPSAQNQLQEWKFVGRAYTQGN